MVQLQVNTIISKLPFQCDQVSTLVLKRSVITDFEQLTCKNQTLEIYLELNCSYEELTWDKFYKTLFYECY
jgi:hypothetical protein